MTMSSKSENSLLDLEVVRERSGLKIDSVTDVTEEDLTVNYIIEGDFLIRIEDSYESDESRLYFNFLSFFVSCLMRRSCLIEDFYLTEIRDFPDDRFISSSYERQSSSFKII